MTKKADKKDRPTAQLFVYSQDAAGKPRGARFPATKAKGPDGPFAEEW